jgi:general stress protein 26
MTEAHGSHDKNDIDRVWKLIKDIDLCMFTSHDEGRLRARPMSSHARQDENVIYFLTDVRGHKDQEIEADDRVCLSYAKPSDGKFLAVTGRAKLLNDRDLIRDLWDKDAEAYWQGADDPDVRVIAVTPEDAQFWEGPHGVVAVVQMVVAAATAMPPVLGDQRKVDLH